MLRTYVMNVCYLQSNVYEFDNVKYTAAASGGYLIEVGFVPRGAEVVRVNIEAINQNGETFNVGIEGDESYFANNITLTGNTQATSDKCLTAEKTEKIFLKTTAIDNDTKIRVRIQYFAPGKILQDA